MKRQWRRRIWASVLGTTAAFGLALAQGGKDAPPSPPKVGDVLTLPFPNGMKKQVKILKVDKQPDGSYLSEVKDLKTGDTFNLLDPHGKSSSAYSSKSTSSPSKSTSAASDPPKSREPLFPALRGKTNDSLFPPGTSAPPDTSYLDNKTGYGPRASTIATPATMPSSTQDPPKRQGILARIFGKKPTAPASTNSPTSTGMAPTVPAPAAMPPSVRPTPGLFPPMTGLPGGEPPLTYPLKSVSPPTPRPSVPIVPPSPGSSSSSQLFPQNPPSSRASTSSQQLFPQTTANSRTSPPKQSVIPEGIPAPLPSLSPMPSIPVTPAIQDPPRITPSAPSAPASLPTVSVTPEKITPAPGIPTPSTIPSLPGIPASSGIPSPFPSIPTPNIPAPVHVPMPAPSTSPEPTRIPVPAPSSLPAPPNVPAPTSIPAPPAMLPAIPIPSGGTSAAPRAVIQASYVSPAALAMMKDIQPYANTLRTALAPSERILAIRSLAGCRHASTDAVKSLLFLSCKNDPCPLVRACCIDELCKLGCYDPAFLAHLQKACEDPSADVKTAAEAALTKMMPKK